MVAQEPRAGIAPFLDTAGDPPVRGVMHHSATPHDAIVLAHGAGGNRDAPFLAALAAAFAEAGVLALRCDLPFRQQRASGPPRAGDAERDREGLRRAAQVLRGRVAGRVLMGGHSYGGRQASMLLAEDTSVASALLLLAYPLHPPRRPTELRTAHLPSLRVPVLFVHGSRDPFGSLVEIDAARAIIPGASKVLAIEGAGHDLTPSRRSPAGMGSVHAAVVKAFVELAAGPGLQATRIDAWSS